MIKDMHLIQIFLKKKINYEIKKNLHLGLRDTIKWYIENSNWVKNVNKSYNFERLGLID